MKPVMYVGNDRMLMPALSLPHTVNAVDKVVVNGRDDT